jgi:glycosyltransferase involved in cell wall biosynthesis
VGEASDPVFRVLEDPSPTLRLASLGLDGAERLVVYVGGFGPHKNLEALLGAFAPLAHQSACSDVRLVLVGEYRHEVFHSESAALQRRLEALGLAGRVVFTGYLPDDDLVVLLNRSAVLVLPSLMEGFGLPAVEAAACGCPVIATRASPLPDLLGEAAIYIDPGEPGELASALQRVLDSAELRRQMRTAGLAAVRRLTWEAAAEQMIALLGQVGRR